MFKYIFDFIRRNLSSIFSKAGMIELIYMLFLFDVLFQVAIIPTHSMNCTLQPGDVAIASKYSYGWSSRSFIITRLIESKFGIRLFNGVYFSKPIKRGHVVAFAKIDEGSSNFPQTLCKRVIAIGGDVVKMVNGVWYVKKKGDSHFTCYEQKRNGNFEYIDGESEVVCSAMFSQNTDGVNHYVLKSTAEGGVFSQNMKPTYINEGYIWLIGDNMDRSGDSRFFGAQPKENVLGRVVFILLSTEFPKIESSSEMLSIFPLEVIRQLLMGNFSFAKPVLFGWMKKKCFMKFFTKVT